MFPCTAGVDLFPCCVDIHGIVSSHVETVLLLGRKQISDYVTIRVNTADLEENVSFKRC